MFPFIDVRDTVCVWPDCGPRSDVVGRSGSPAGERRF